MLRDRMRVLTFFGFENRKKIFEIDSRYKFVCLTAGKLAEQESPPESFDATFMRLDVEELETGAPADALITLNWAELESLSPGTLALLEFRSARDREIVVKMSGLKKGQEIRPLLGNQGTKSWGVHYYREFDMTNDKKLWTKSGGHLWTPSEVCGLRWPEDPAIHFADVRVGMAAKGFWPLYEGKQIDQWLTDTKPIARWLSLETCKSENGKLPSPAPKLVFRDIARNTDERTCIAAVLPVGSCSCNTLATLRIEGISEELAASVMNSLSFDYLVRPGSQSTAMDSRTTERLKSSRRMR